MSRRLAGETVAEKLALNSVRDGECLRWTGAHISTGYGHIHVNGKRVAVHRVALELAQGWLTPGLDVDHKQSVGCRFRDCIEPSHLEEVTHGENVRRSIEFGARKRVNVAGQRICPAGHVLEGANLRPPLTPRHRGGCRECDVIGKRAARALKAKKVSHA